MDLVLFGPVHCRASTCFSGDSEGFRASGASGMRRRRRSEEYHFFYKNSWFVRFSRRFIGELQLLT